MGRGEKAGGRRQGGVNGRLPRNVVQSQGVRGEGAKVEGGGRRGMGEKGTPKKLGIANQCGTKRFALRSNKITLLIPKQTEIR